MLFCAILLAVFQEKVFTMVKVSVCVPVYGVEQFIERCACSLFEQTMRDDIEFIFVDDRSPDNSIEILEKTLSRYPERKAQTRIIRHESNQGLVRARKTALEAAAGEYIIHCDSDDWVEPQTYQTLYDMATTQNADIVCMSYSLDYDDAPKKSVHLPKLRKNSDPVQLLIDCNLYWGVVFKLVRRSVALNSVTYAGDELCFGEDLLRSSQMLCAANKVVFCDSLFYHYYQGNRNSYTKTFKREFLDQLAVIANWIDGNLPQINTLSLKGDIIFHGTVRNLWRKNELKELFKGKHLGIVTYSGLHIVKRMVVLAAFISYPLTAKLCRLLFARRYNLK